MPKGIDFQELSSHIRSIREKVESKGETFYQGPSATDLSSFPPKELWSNWSELDSKSWPERKVKTYSLIPTTCFNCESACGLLAYVDKESGVVRKFEGNPEHPGSRGRNCAKGPATLNQITDPDRILYPLKRAGARGEGKWQRVSWDEALDDIASRVRKAISEGATDEVVCHIGRPGEDGFTERVLASWGVDGHNSNTNSLYCYITISKQVTHKVTRSKENPTIPFLLHHDQYLERSTQNICTSLGQAYPKQRFRSRLPSKNASKLISLDPSGFTVSGISPPRLQTM